MFDNIRYFRISKEDLEYDNWEQYWQDILENKVETVEKELAEQPEEVDARTFRNETGLTINEMLLSEDRYVNYLNQNKRSNVNAYAVGDNYILVKFNDSSVYLYTDKLLTQSELDRLKDLANYGAGLNGYLTRLIGNRYTARYYKNHVFIKPGLEAVDYRVALEAYTPEVNANSDCIREKNAIKHLMLVVETNHAIREKRLRDVLRRSLEELYVPLTRTEIATMGILTGALNGNSNAVRTLFVTPRDKFSFIPEMLVDSNHRSIFDASVYMVSTFYNLELIKLVNQHMSSLWPGAGVPIFKAFNDFIDTQYTELRLPGEYTLKSKTRSLSKFNSFMWEDKLLDQISDTNVELAIRYANATLMSFSVQHDKINRMLLKLCRFCSGTLTKDTSYATMVGLTNLIQLTDDLNNYLMDLLIGNLYLIGRAK